MMMGMELLQKTNSTLDFGAALLTKSRVTQWPIRRTGCSWRQPHVKRWPAAFKARGNKRGVRLQHGIILPRFNHVLSDC